jgi:hypothetical protein
MANNKYSIGILLVAVAVILLLGKLGVIAFLGRLFWPLLILALGIALHGLYYARVTPSWVVVPGGILVTYSLLFLFCNIFGWGAMKYLWPVYIFGVAVGLYEWYRTDRFSPRVLLNASVILAVVSVLLFMILLLFSVSMYWIVGILVIAGIVMMFTRRRAG